MWPEAEYGDPKSEEVKSGKLKPWRTAADCIDWAQPTRSILGRKKPLADNTMRRIVRGLLRYVIDNPDPYIVRIGQTGFGGDRLSYSSDQPLTTVTSKAEHLLLEPFAVKCNHTSNRTSYDCFRGQSLHEPLQTITQAHGFSLAAPVVVRQFGNSTGHKADAPLGTVTAGGGGKSQLMSAVLVGAGGPKYSGKPRAVDTPMITLPATSHTALASATLIQVGYGEREGQAPRALDLDKPLGTVVAGGIKHALVAANLVKHYGGNYTGAGLGMDGPLHTVTQVDHHAICTSHLVQLYGTSKDGRKITEPAPTVTSGGQHTGHVQAFLQKYYGNEKDGIDVADGTSELNEQSQGVTTERLSEGVYRVSGVFGFNGDGAWGGAGNGIEIPVDDNKRALVWVDSKVLLDGDVEIRTYHRTYATGPYSARNIEAMDSGEVDKKKQPIFVEMPDGTPIDIPEGRFIDLRVEMPARDEPEPEFEPDPASADERSSSAPRLKTAHAVRLPISLSIPLA
mgnify:CR=1 FL=1